MVLAANGEVHTNEEAQVYLHDLNLFVTVQLLEETLPVLSLGKLFEDHRYTYEWAGGQKPRLTEEGTTILCKTDNFVPLVFQGYPPVLGPIRRQHRHRRICQQVQLKSKVTNWPHESGADHPQKPKTKNNKRDDSRDADDRLRYLPEWLEEFHRKSRRCRRARTRTHCARLRFGTSCKSGTQEEQYFDPLPKRSKLRSMLANQDDKGSCRRRTGEAGSQSPE